MKPKVAYENIRRTFQWKSRRF